MAHDFDLHGHAMRVIYITIWIMDEDTVARLYYTSAAAAALGRYGPAR
jgi:hypothetical protein